MIRRYLEMKNYSIECLNPGTDSKRILVMLKELDKDFIPVLSKRVNLSAYAEKIATYATIFIVRHENKDCGECSIYLNNESVGYITSFGITRDHRKTGASGFLMDAVVSHCINRNFPRIKLRVACENFIARNFYLRRGFRILESDETWMEMELSLNKGDSG